MRVPKFLIKFHQRIQNTRLWKLRWKILAVAPFILALGVFLFYTAYRILAEKTHQEFVTSWEAKGETMDIDTLFPPQGNPEDDFFSHPAVIAETRQTYANSLQPLYRSGITGLSDNSKDFSCPDGQGTYAMGIPADSRRWLDPYDPALDEKTAAGKCLELIAPISKRLDTICSALQRKNAYFSKNFDEQGGVDGLTSTTTRFRFSRFPTLLGDRCILHLIHGNEKAAARDLNHAIQAVHLFRKDHSLIGYLIAAAQLQTLQQPLWEGLSRHTWSEASLANFEHQLSSMNEHSRFLQCMRQEMAYTNLVLQSMHRDPAFQEKQLKFISPSSPSTSKTWKERGVEALENIKPRGWYLKRGTEQLSIFDNYLFYPQGKLCKKLSMDQVKTFNRIKNPLYSPLFDVLKSNDDTMSMYAWQIAKALRTQAVVHNMRTAIALERYRLKHNQYPATLNDLVPHFLPHVLEDVITGKPLNYRIKSDGTPLIYSIGSDEKDNGGHPHFDPEKGDWAWMYSPPAGFTYSDYKRR